MNFSQVTFLLSAICWIFPLIKQRNTDYFYFFFVLAIADPLRLILYTVFKIQPGLYFPFFSYLLLVFLVNKKHRVWILLIAVISILLPNVFHWSLNWFLGFTIINHVIISYIFISLLITYLVEEKAINMFVCAVILYEFITVLKLIALLLNLQQGTISFYIATFMQFVFGILFSFININTKGFRIKHYSEQ